MAADMPTEQLAPLYLQIAVDTGSHSNFWTSRVIALGPGRDVSRYSPYIRRCLNLSVSKLLIRPRRHLWVGTNLTSSQLTTHSIVLLASGNFGPLMNLDRIDLYCNGPSERPQSDSKYAFLPRGLVKQICSGGGGTVPKAVPHGCQGRFPHSRGGDK